MGRAGGPPRDVDRAGQAESPISSHYDTRPYNPATSQDESQAIESQLTPQQLQLFAAQN